MKKLMAICAATLMLAGIATSCSKNCECTSTYEGVSYTEEINIENTEYKSCAALAQDAQEESEGTVKVTCRSK